MNEASPNRKSKTVAREEEIELRYVDNRLITER